MPARCCARHLDAQLGGHPACLLPVAPRDADQARVVGVVRQRLLERREAVEQAPDLGIREALVDDAAERRERIGARLRCRAAASTRAAPSRARRRRGRGRRSPRVARRRVVRSSICGNLPKPGAARARIGSRRMTDVLIIGDTFRSPELRNEIPLGVPDPFVYLEHDGDAARLRRVDGGRPRFAGSASTSRCTRSRRSGSTSSTRRASTTTRSRLEWVARACAHAGLEGAIVPHTFPAGHLDRMRQEGIELTVDQPSFDARRRVKTGAQLEGIRRAQRAAEAGLGDRHRTPARASENATACSGSTARHSRSSASSRRCG